MIKIALIGYGKMGRLLKGLAIANNLEIVAIIDPSIPLYNREINSINLNGAEVALEFTQPDNVIDRITKLAECGVDIVIGTSGWYDNLEEVSQIADKNKVGIIYGANFSIGMNIFFEMMEKFSEVMSKIPEYDLYACEEHHNKKRDRPSGTAKYITSIIEKNMPSVKEQDTFQFESIRAGSKPGTHLVGFDSEYDFIELKHLARDRKAFLSGAIKSVDWIKGRVGFYNFSTVFKEIFKIDS